MPETTHEIKNHDEIIKQLTQILITFAKDSNPYQTDVYLYYNTETQTARLDTFVNVGGNSWLDDDHYTIYRDTEHFDKWYDYFETSELAYCLDIRQTDFENEVKEFLELDEEDKQDYKINYSDALNYILSREDYTDKLTNIYKQYIDEMQPEYVQQAENIINEWEQENFGVPEFTGTEDEC